jgi:hypothetical protein
MVVTFQNGSYLKEYYVADGQVVTNKNVGQGTIRRDSKRDSEAESESTWDSA